MIHLNVIPTHVDIKRGVYPAGSRALSNHGAALPLVLFFALAAMLTASTYVYTQYTLRRPAVQYRSSLQALLNARSGVWIGLKMVNDMQDQTDDTTGIDTTFGNGLFDTPDTAFEEKARLPGEGRAPAVVYPYRDSTFGCCSLSVDARGCFLLLRCVGVHRDKHGTVEAFLGSRPFQYPDTVLVLGVAGSPDGMGSVRGEALFLAYRTDSAQTDRTAEVDERFDVSIYRKQLFLQRYTSLLGASLDTALESVPTTVKDNDDFRSLPDVVNGMLIVDGTFGAIDAGQRRTLIVQGDLQFNGDTQIENVEFIVEGEIRVLDKVRLTRVDLFSMSRMFFAGETEFTGSAVASGDIEIYEAAVIAGRSTLVSLGSAQAPVVAAPGGDTLAHASEARGRKAAKRFCVHIRDRAVVDAAVVSIAGGIETEPSTTITGILWSQSVVAHAGTLAGAIRAQALVDESNPGDAGRNILNGSVEPLEDIAEYTLPYFIGHTRIVHWRERI